MTEPTGMLRAIDLCEREVVRLARDAPLREVARLLAERDTSAIVVTDDDAARSAPVGVVTRRDLVRAVARAPAPMALRAGDFVAPVLAFAHGSDAVLDALARMETLAVAAIPVLDDGGAVVGLLTLED
jgi:CBS domain-containing protein